MPALPEMGSHHSEATFDVPSADVVSVLRARPAGWLRAFLRLAAHDSGSATGTRLSSPWFRLGLRDDSSPESMVASLTWWPHAEQDGVFTRFQGQLIVSACGNGTLLRIEGHANNGTRAVNEVVLSRLLKLIGSAMSVRHAGDG
jgi:hypothetical protein